MDFAITHQQEKRRILFLDMLDTSSAYYRIYIVNDAISRLGLATAVSAAALLHYSAKDNIEIFGKKLLQCTISSDIIICEGYPTHQTKAVIQWCHYSNKPFLIEIDDLVEHTTKWIDEVTGNRARNKWLDRVSIWRHADGFITSTEYLANHYSRKFGKPAWTFENQLDYNDRRWREVVNTNRENPVIGYMGSESHRDDLLMIKDAIYRIAKEYPKVTFKFLGIIPAEFQEKLKGRVEYFSTERDIGKYPKIMADFDIGLMPLKAELFNFAKSDLKFLEYARLNIPGIASNIITYNRTIEDGKTGLLADNNPGDWYKKIKYLLDNPKERAKIGSAAHKYLKENRNIDSHASEYIDIIEAAIERKGPKRKPSELLIARKR